MKLLCSSSDLGELEGLVKRLVCVGIRCAVCKDSSNSHLSVWIQQDNDFPLALRIFVKRDAPRRLPHWACVLNSSPLATEVAAAPVARGAGGPSSVLVQPKGPTRTGTA